MMLGDEETIQWVNINRSGDLPDRDEKYVLRGRVSKREVSVIEFQSFIDNGGYDNESLWSVDGWAWRCDNGVSAPTFHNSREHQYTLPSMPITGVSYYEAEAFSRFMGASILSEFQYRVLATDGFKSRYPWGNSPAKDLNFSFFGEFSEDRRTSTESSITPSVDGIYGLLSNVAQWCYLGGGNSEKMAALCGGSVWNTPLTDATWRDVLAKTTRDNQTGIRLAKWEEFEEPASLLPSVAVREQVAEFKARRPTRPFRQEGLPESIDRNSYRLKVSGVGINEPRNFCIDELRELFRVRRKSTFLCVCRWGQRNTVEGFRLSDILAKAGFIDTSRTDLYLKQISLPGPNGVYETTVPLSQALNNNALIVDCLDDEVLTSELGAPFRYWDTQIYGYKQVKALAGLEIVSTWEPGWWESKQGYDITGEIQAGSFALLTPTGVERWDYEP